MQILLNTWILVQMIVETIIIIEVNQIAQGQLNRGVFFCSAAPTGIYPRTGWCLVRNHCDARIVATQQIAKAHRPSQSRARPCCLCRRRRYSLGPFHSLRWFGHIDYGRLQRQFGLGRWRCDVLMCASALRHGS
jgi:hypothetical protein